MIVGTKEHPLESRLVRCNQCNHKFMWIKDTGGVKLYTYHLRINGTEGFIAECPVCKADMVVFDGIEEGLNEYDHRIKYCYSDGSEHIIEEELLLLDSIKEHEYLWTTEKHEWVLNHFDDGYLIFNQVSSMALLVDNEDLACSLIRIMLFKGNKVIELGQEQ